MEEAFFKDSRKEEATSAVLEEEMASRRTPPQPPTPPASEVAPSPPPGDDVWVDTGTGESATQEPVPTPVAAVSKGSACPDCGNAMQSLGPDGGNYCPMCGHQEGA